MRPPGAPVACRPVLVQEEEEEVPTAGGGGKVFENMATVASKQARQAQAPATHTLPLLLLPDLTLNDHEKVIYFHV